MQGNNTILAGRTVSTGTYGKTSGSTAVSSLIGSGLTGSSLGTLLAAGKGENLSGKTGLIWCRSSVFR